MIDWSIAQRVAATLAGSPPRAALPDDIAQRSADYAKRVSAYTGLVPETPLPAPEGVDRGEWIAANHDSMRPLLEMVVSRMSSGLGPFAGAARSFTGTLMGVQVGALTGLLAQRVLGQYDVMLLDGSAPARLLLVAPNLDESARKLEVDLDELTSWVTVHEVTHAVQFTSVTWLRGHLAGLITELLEGIDVGATATSMLRVPKIDDLRELVTAARTGNLVQVVLGPERQETVDRIQAVMSLIEGHAEHVMDAVGADVVSDLPALRSALDERRANRPPLWRVLERLLGLELKMRQYEDGRRFCDAVVKEAGMAQLNRAWSDPERLPTLEELHDPSRWIDRTRVPIVTSGTV